MKYDLLLIISAGVIKSHKTVILIYGVFNEQTLFKL